MEGKGEVTRNEKARERKREGKGEWQAKQKGKENTG